MGMPIALPPWLMPSWPGTNPVPLPAGVTPGTFTATSPVPVTPANAGPSIYDMALNTAGLPITADECNQIVSQTTASVQRACGQLVGTPWCNQQVQQAVAAVQASCKQSNQQLCGFPANILGCGGGGGPNTNGLSIWAYLALGLVGALMVYEIAS